MGRAFLVELEGGIGYKFLLVVSRARETSLWLSIPST